MHKILHIARHHRKSMLDGSCGNHCAALHIPDPRSERDAHRSGVFGKQQNPARKSGTHARQPTAQRTAAQAHWAFQKVHNRHVKIAQLIDLQKNIIFI